MATIEFDVPDDFLEEAGPKFDVKLNLDEAGAVLSDGREQLSEGC